MKLTCQICLLNCRNMEKERSNIKEFNVATDPNKIGQEWASWRENFQLYLMMKGDLTNSQKFATLLVKAGKDVQSIYRSRKETIEAEKVAKQAENEDTDSDESDTPLNEYEEALFILDSVFIHQKNDSFQRNLFRQIAQGPKETIVSYVARLRLQVKFCGYSNESEIETAIKDQIMDKARSMKLKRKIWENDRDLNGVISLAQALENAEIYEQAHSLEDAKETNQRVEPEINYVDQNKFKRYGQGRSLKPETRRFKTKQTLTCWACGKSGHRKFDTICPAKNQRCTKCGNRGHYAALCRTVHPSQKVKYFHDRRSKTSDVVKSIESDSDDESKPSDYVLNVDEGNTENIECVVGGVSLKMIIDSGSKRNLIPFKTWNKMKELKVKVKEEVKGSDITMRAYGQLKPIPVHGRFRADLKVNNVRSEQWFYITLTEGKCLLGSETSKAHNVLKTGLLDVDVNLVNNEFPKMKGKNFMEDWK